MHRLQRLLAVAFLTLIALPAFGQYTRDASANKKIDEAINTHYLNTEFDKAESVLTGTIKACGDKCSPAVVAKAWMYVGIVRGSAKNDQAGAKDAFVKAIAADPGVKLDVALATPETQKTFQDAGGTAGAATTTPPPPPETETKPPAAGESGEGITCTPDTRDVQTRRPIPVACTSDEDVTSMELRYKPFGADTWRSVKMEKGKDFRGTIPCDATQDQGTLRIYVRGKDAQGEITGSWGTKTKPIEFNIAEDVSVEPPAYEGMTPPARCAAKEECPPDFPGCGAGAGPKRGNKDWGASCENSAECKSGLLCTSGTCETAASCESNAECETGSCVHGQCDIGEGELEGPVKFKRHWLGLHIAQDIAFIGGTDVCSQTTQGDDNYACFYEGTEKPFGDPPFPGTGIATGSVVATTRFLLSYGFAVTPNIEIGLRAGYAIRGGPPAGQTINTNGTPNDPSDDTASGGTAFLPIHAELRGTYWFGHNALGKKGLRPYLAVGGGMAQVDAKVPVTVKDCRKDFALGGASEAECTLPAQGFNDQALPDVKLDAWKKLGQGFLNVGGGLAFAFKENMALQLNVNFMYMLPSSGPVIEPSLGFSAGL